LDQIGRIADASVIRDRYLLLGSQTIRPAD
jgi:hypothetical protein